MDSKTYDPSQHSVTKEAIKDTRKVIDSVGDVLAKHNPRLAKAGGMKPRMTASEKSTFHNGYMVTAKNKDDHFLVEIKSTEKKFYHTFNTPVNSIDEAVKNGITFITENLQ